MTLPGQCGKTEMEGRRLENAVNKRVKPPLPKKPTIPAKLACGGLDNQLKGVHPKSKATGVTQAYNNNNSQIVNEVDTKGMKQNCNSIGGDKYLVNEDRTNSSADHESHNGIAAGPSLHVGFVGGGDIGGGVRKDDLTLPEDEQSWWKIESENVSFVKSEVGIQPESDSPVSDNCAVGQCSGDSGVDSDERHGSKCWRAGTAAGKASSNAIQARLPSSVSDDVELLSHSDSRDSFSGEELHGAGPPPHPPVFGSAQPCAGPIEMKVQRCEVTPNAHVLNNIITDNKAYTTVNLEEESGGFQCAVVQGPVEVREASRKAVVELFSSSSKTGSVKKGAFGSEDNLESTSFSLICCTADGSGSKVMEGLNSRVPCLGPQEKAEMRFFDIGGGSGTNGGVPPFPVELSVEPLYAQSRKKKTNEKGKMTEVNVTPQTGAYDNMVNSCGDNTTDCSEEPVLDYLALTDKDDYDSTSPEHVYETLGRKGNLYSGVEQHAPIASKTAKSSLGKPGASGLVQPLVNDEFSIYAEVVDQKEPPTKEPMLKPYASQSDCPRRLVDASDRSTSSSTTPVEPLVLPAILQGSVSTGAEQDEPAEPPPRTTGSLGFGAHFQRKFSSRIKSKAGSAKAENCGSSLSSVTSSRPDENVVREGNVRHKLRRWQSLRVFFRWRRPEDETTKARQTCDKKQTLEGKLWSQSTESGLSVKTERNTESLPSLQIPITSSSNTSFSNASETRIAMVPVHSSTSNPPNSTPQPTISSLAPTKRSLQAPDDAEPYLINRGQGLDHGEKPQANREVPILREAQGRGQPGQAPGSEGGSNTEGSTGVMTEIYSNIGMGRACMVPPKHPRQRDQPEAAWPSPKTSPPLAPALIRLKPNQLPASELELNQSPSKLPQNLLKHCNTESVKNTLAPEVSARLATPMSVTTEANNSEVSTVQPSLIFSDVWDTTAVSERIRCLHLTALKSFAAKYQVMFEEQRPVLHNVCWKDFSLLSETPICSTTSGTYFRASCTKDIQRPYTLKFCHSTSVGNPTPPLRDNSSHFNIQHVASFFHTDTLAHSEANRPAGKQIARRLVLASADVPTQTLADFIRTTSHFHRAHPDIYEKQTCLLLLQLSSAVEHKVYGSLSQDNMDPDALLLSMPMGLVSQSPACQDPPDSACLPRILIEAGHGTPQRVSKTKVADAQNAPEFYIGVLVYQLLHLPNPFADSSYEDVANDLPPIPRLSIYSPGLEKLARLLLAPTGHIPATEACTVLRCLLWGPRDEMLRVLSSQSRIGSNKQCAVALRNWRDIKCTLLLMKLAEMALEPGASGISLEDWLCLQYLTTSSTDDISRATFLLQQG